MTEEDAKEKERVQDFLKCFTACALALSALSEDEQRRVINALTIFLDIE